MILKLYRRTNARNISLDWNLNSFRHKEIGKEREFTEIVNGLKYIVHQLQVGLFGIQAGSFKAGPATIELDLLFQDTKTKSHSPFNLFFNDPFFGGGQRKEHKILRSNFVNIKVQPFPQLGKPNNFERLVGSVARYSLRSGRKSVGAGGHHGAISRRTGWRGGLDLQAMAI